jgi:hypothetical protein
MDWDANPLAWTKIDPVAADPVVGTAEEGMDVINKVFPGGVAKIVLTGLCKLPIGLNAESDSVHPKALDPETIFVEVPLIYMVLFKFGVPLVIFN